MPIFLAFIISKTRLSKDDRLVISLKIPKINIFNSQILKYCFLDWIFHKLIIENSCVEMIYLTEFI